MTQTLKIFSYKGSVGANSDLENGKFLNDIKGEGQMGIVVAVEDVSITTEALEIMKTNYMREGGSFSNIMVTRSENKDFSNSIGLMGFGMHGIAIKGKVAFSRDCDLSVLDEINIDDEMVIPEDFKEFIDSE